MIGGWRLASVGLVMAVMLAGLGQVFEKGTQRKQGLAVVRVHGGEPPGGIQIQPSTASISANPSGIDQPWVAHK